MGRAQPILTHITRYFRYTIHITINVCVLQMTSPLLLSVYKGYYSHSLMIALSIIQFLQLVGRYDAHKAV